MSLDLVHDLKKILGLQSTLNADSNVVKTIDLSYGDVGTVSFNKCDSSQNNDSKLLVSGPVRIHSLDFYVSAAGGDARWNLVNASASAAAGTALGSTLYTFRPVLAGGFGEDFIRPLVFDKGIVIAYTATAGAFGRQVYYSVY